MVRLSVLAWLSIAVVASAGYAQDGYRIRIRSEEKVGDRRQISEVEKSIQKMSLADANGKVLKKNDEQEDRSQTYVETVLAKEPGKRPSKLTRKFEKAALKEQGKIVEVPLAGKTVTIERKDGKYAFRLDEGELTAPMLKFLNDSFKHESEKEVRFNDIFFSKEAVSVGQSWKCDPKAIVDELVKDFASDADFKNATAAGKLTDVYQKDGHPYGKIDIDVNVPIKSVGDGAEKLVAKPGAHFKMKLHFDTCIDGTRSEGTMNGTMEIFMLADLPLPNGKTGTLNALVTGTIEETRKDLK